jgi:ABC-type phosphate transport system substrate-binding protein
MYTDVSVDSRRASGPPNPTGKLGRISSRLALPVALVLVVGALSPFVASVIAPPAYANGPTINGAGSSYAALAIDQWVDQISSLDGDQINYSDSSSVIGLNEFAQQQVDFGASEIGYSTGQANYTPPTGYAYQYLPDVAGATCMDYNLQSPITGEPITNLQLTTAMILGIFTGTITTWGGLATGGLNPELAGDGSPIITVFRTDASGENYILSDYLNTIDPSQWATYTSALNFTGGAQAIWPFPQGGGSHPGYNFSNWNGEDGSDNASSYVFGNTGSITYVETAYANAHHDPCAAVQNLPNDAFVQPSALADAEALLDAQLQPDLEQNLTNVFTDTNPKAYAISAYSYLVTPEGQMSAARGAVLGQFVEFFACQGQQSAVPLGYSPLPPNLVDDDFAGISRINGAAAPPSTVNAQTCNDPYVSLFGSKGPPPSSGGGGSKSTGPSKSGGGSNSHGASTFPTSSTGPTATTTPTSASGPNTTSTTTPGSKTTNGTPTVGVSTGPSASVPTTTTTDPDIGLALFGTAGHLDAVTRPVAPAVLVAIGFLLLIAIPPTVAWIRIRRRRQVKEI